MSDGVERTREEGQARVRARELADTTEATAEQEPGQGEPHCGYGVEVVELLEMEPVGSGGRGARRRLPWKKYASVAFILAFVLGIVNAGASLYMSSLVVSPADIAGSRGCEISGEVLDAAGNPIPNATVVVTDTTMSAFTNRDGMYTLKGIPPGGHRVEAAAKDYNHMSVKTDIHPDMLNVIDFTLEKGGPDVSVDESAAPDFSQAGSSYIWAVPLMVGSSVCALAAAMLSLGRKDRWRTIAFFGALGALSFGFGVGSILALAGIAMIALALPVEGPLPRKKLRVGVSYPSKALAARRAAGEAPSAGVPKPPAAIGGMPSLRPVPDAEGSEPPLERVPAAEGSGPELPAVPAAESEGDVAPAVRPPLLRDRTADGELDTAGSPGARTKATGPAGPDRPRRLVRRSTRARLLCYTCVEEIKPGAVYVKCSCGRSIHSGCLKQPRCPCCGRSFGRTGA